MATEITTCGCEIQCQQFGDCQACGQAAHWQYSGGFGRGRMIHRCVECGGEHSPMEQEVDPSEGQEPEDTAYCLHCQQETAHIAIWQQIEPTETLMQSNTRVLGMACSDCGRLNLS